MAEIGNVTVRIDAVITDEQYREAMSAVRVANERMDQLRVENARLRELLQRTWDAFHDATAREFVTVKNELRELGIEVVE
jgi:hypothetical protein